MSPRSKREYQTAIRTNIFNFESSSEKSKAFTAETPRRGEIITSPCFKKLKIRSSLRLRASAVQKLWFYFIGLRRCLVK